MVLQVASGGKPRRPVRLYGWKTPPSRRLKMKLSAALLSILLVIALASPSLAQEARFHGLAVPAAAEANEGDPVWVTWFADGGVKQALDGQEAQAGSGSLGLSFNYERAWGLSIAITVVSTADSVTSGYGPTLLDVNLGSRSPSATLEYWKDLGIRVFPWPTNAYAYGSVSKATWVLPSEEEEDPAEGRDATILGLGVGLQWTEVAYDSNNEFSFTGSAGLFARHVGGQLGDDSAFLSGTLGDDRQNLFGLEMALSASVGATAVYTRLYVSPHGQVPGVKGANAVFGISLRPALLTCRCVRRK